MEKQQIVTRVLYGMVALRPESRVCILAGGNNTLFGTVVITNPDT